MTISNSEDATQRELSRALETIGEQTKELLRRGQRIEDLEHEVEALKHTLSERDARILFLETQRAQLHAQAAQ